MSIAYEFDFTQHEPGSFRWRRSDDSAAEFQCGSYRLDVRGLPNRAYLEPIEADVLDVIAAIHIADRVALRRPQGTFSADGWWARRIRIRVAVRAIERWENPEVQKWLDKYLYLNTSDNYQFEFVPRDDNADEEANGNRRLDFDRRVMRSHRNATWRVALFSGGLDGLAGLAWQLEEFPRAKFVLISFNTNSRLRKSQQRLIERLPNGHYQRVEHIPLRMSLHVDVAREEDSLRTRGLLFLTAAGLTAHMMGRDEFFVYENGIGAFNLPFDHSQFIGHNTRAVHPSSLAFFSQFLTALLRQPLQAVNPFQFATKGEMCRVLAPSAWSGLIHHTWSCSHGQRVKDTGILHCGLCGSCILRRQSLRVAGLLREDVSKYFEDLHHIDSVPNAKRREWIAMHEQQRRIERALNGSQNDREAWLRLVNEFPELMATARDMAAVQPLSEHEIQHRILGLLRRYVAEGLALDVAPLRALPQEQEETNDVRRSAVA